MESGFLSFSGQQKSQGTAEEKMEPSPFKE